MNSVAEYIERVVLTPVRVCVVDSEEETCYQIEDALSVYNCEVKLSFDEEEGCRCLRDGLGCPADLIFVSADIQPVESVRMMIEHIESTCPEASVVVLTRKPTSPAVVDLMRHGAYTFLVKNGSFDDAHIRKIFRQLNVKLRSKAEKCCEQV